MSKSPGIEKSLRQSLGKDAADAVLAKVEKMLKKGAKAPAIEKAVAAALQSYFEQQVVQAAISEAGPISPAKVRRIQAKVKPVLSKFISGVPKLPAIPRVHGAPMIHAVPKVPGAPKVHGVPKVPGVPKVHGVPKVAGVPKVHGVPKVNRGPASGGGKRRG